MNRDEAVHTARHWLARQPAIFRARWASGPAELGHIVGDDDLPISPKQLEAGLDLVRDIKTGRLKGQGKIKEALEQWSQACETDFGQGGDLDPDLWRVATVVACQRYPGLWPYQQAQIAMHLLEHEETRRVLENALTEGRKPLSVRDRLEAAVTELTAS
jgi:hypothetical protein